MAEPEAAQRARRSRPLSPRQVACLRAVAAGSLHIEDGTAMRTVKSLEARGLLEMSVRHGRCGWYLTPLGRGAILDLDGRA